MRNSIRAALFTLACLAVIPAYGGSAPDLTIALAPDSGSFSPTGDTVDAGDCLSQYCVLFSGAITNNDTDDSIMSLGPASVLFATTPASGGLSIDETFYNDVPGILIGDPTYSYPDSSPYYQYTGPIFGIDVAPGTTPGIYDGTLSVYTQYGTNDTGPGETFTADFSVDVLAPEPSAASLLLAGCLPLAIWFGVKRRCRSSEASR
jgi:hypothetical protein